MAASAKTSAGSRSPRKALSLADAVNSACPWSGSPVRADSLTLYKGQVVGFCNPGCRDKFETATRLFDTAIAKRGRKQGGRAIRTRNARGRAK
jgi:hypothetical protein